MTTILQFKNLKSIRPDRLIARLLLLTPLLLPKPLYAAPSEREAPPLSADGSLFFRITNPPAAKDSTFYRLQFRRTAPSLIEAGYAGAAGLVQPDSIYQGKHWIKASLNFNSFNRSGIPTAQYLAPGQSTPWIDLAPFLGEKGGNALRLTALKAEGKKAKEFDGIVTFSRKPDDDARIKTIDRTVKSACQVIQIPVDPGDKEPIQDAQAAIEGQLAALERLGSFPGKRPEKFTFFAPLKVLDEMPVEWWSALWRTFARLGINQTNVPLAARAQIGAEPFDAMARAQGIRSFDFYRNSLPSIVNGFDVDKLDAITANLVEREVKPAKALGDLGIYSTYKYLDEPCLYRKEPWSRNLLPGHLLAKRLQDKGLKPEDVGAKSWDDVSVPLLNEFEAANPKLWYWSSIALRDAMTAYLSCARKAVKEQFSPEVKTAVTLSAYGLYAEGVKGNMMLSASDYWDIARESTDLLTTDQYPAKIFDISPQIVSFTTDVMRSACKTSNIPFGFYIQTNCAPDLIRLMTYSAISHGATSICYWCYGPSYQTGEMSFSDNPEALAEIARINHEAGSFEDIFFSSKKRKAQTALLYSKTSEIWEKSPPDNSINQEQVFLYLALAHQQIPVDILTEDDVIAGKLKDYRCLYVAGPNLKRPTGGVIAQWVKQGGVLWGSAGAGSRDEFNEENTDLNAVFGLKHRQFEIAKDISTIFPKINLKNYRVLDRIAIHPLDSMPREELPKQIEVLCRKEAMDVEAATVLGSDADGTPAAVLNRYGKGKAILWGGMPGIAYGKKALPQEPYIKLQGKIISSFPAMERNAITLAAIGLAGVERPVELSAPLVESSVFESPEHQLVFLNNYTGQPIERLNVKLKTTTAAVKSVISTQRGPLAFRSGKAGIELNIPLDVNDVLVINL